MEDIECMDGSCLKNERVEVCCSCKYGENGVYGCSMESVGGSSLEVVYVYMGELSSKYVVVNQKVVEWSVYMNGEVWRLEEEVWEVWRLEDKVREV